MGFIHSTYFAFGALVNLRDDQHVWEVCDELDTYHRTTMQQYEIGHLCAGDYDRDKLFLVTFCTEVSVGAYGRVDPFSLGHQETEWKHKLQSCADLMNLRLAEEPSWFVIPDIS